MSSFDSINVTKVSTTCTATGGILTFQGATTYRNVSPQFLSYYVYNVDYSVTRYGTANNTYQQLFTVYDLPNGTYSVYLSDQEGNTTTKVGVVINCAIQCNITTLTAIISPARSAISAEGSLQLNNPSVNQVEYQSDKYPGVWQSSSLFTDLQSGVYVITAREVNNPSCSTQQSFTVPIVLRSGIFRILVTDIIPVVSAALNDGGFTVYSTNNNPDCSYYFTVRRVDTGDVVFTTDAVGMLAGTPNVLLNLNDTQYNVTVTETTPTGTVVNKNQLVIIPRAVQGCTNPTSSNYNPVANIDDGTCSLPTGNNGYQGYFELEEYYLDDNAATGVTKPNVSSDPDYVAPTQNLGNCPI